MKRRNRLRDSHPDGGNGKTTCTQHSSTEKRQRSGSGTCLVILLSAVVACLAVASAYLLRNHLQNLSEESAYIESRLGEEGLELFKGYDLDGDGYISISEFEPMVERLLSDELMNEEVDFSFSEDEVDPAEEVLTLEAHFTPLRQETMKKAQESHSSKYLTALAGLNDWTKPNQAIAGFPVGLFRAFLPDDITPVGEAYTIIKSNLNLFSSTLSSNRFYPPKVKSKEAIIHRILSMFHKRPFVHTRFGPQGTKAVIRAENEKYVDIVFRIHTEFQLNEPPNHPFWFTPGQVVGNIILTKDSSHIQYFNLYVPTNNSLNIDMEWLYSSSETGNMEVDIGFLPQMKLTSPEPSTQVAIYGERGEVLYEPENRYSKRYRETISWDIAITPEEALKEIEVQFYPFKKVPYLPFQEAFQRASAENKLVHSILLWGALDDQSC